MLASSVVVLALLTALSGPAIGQVIPNPTGPGQPLASGQLFGDNAHGAIHCQVVADLFIDPALPPGSAPGSVVITPNGPVYGGPNDGLCAQVYTAFTGQQP